MKIKVFEFQKILIKDEQIVAHYWIDSLFAAQHFYKIFEGRELTNKMIKELWKRTGPQDWLSKLVFKPDYYGIKSHYKRLKSSLNCVNARISDDLEQLGQMLPEDVEDENTIIAQDHIENLKKDSEKELGRLNSKNKKFSF